MEILRTCDIVNCTIEQRNSFHRFKSEFIKANKLSKHLNKFIRRRRKHILWNMPKIIELSRYAKK